MLLGPSRTFLDGSWVKIWESKQSQHVVQKPSISCAYTRILCMHKNLDILTFCNKQLISVRLPYFDPGSIQDGLRSILDPLNKCCFPYICFKILGIGIANYCLLPIGLPMGYDFCAAVDGLCSVPIQTKHVPIGSKSLFQSLSKYQTISYTPLPAL